MTSLPLRSVHASILLALFANVLATGLAAGAPSVVINEVMYHPPADLDDLQYVELFNSGTNTIDLAQWSFSHGVSFTFPAETRIDPGGFLVVCRDLKAFSAHYTNSARAVGNFSG